MTEEELEAKGYVKREKTIEIMKAYKIAIISTVILSIVGLLGYIIVWGFLNVLNAPWKIYFSIVAIVIGGFALHQLIHGIGFGIFSSGKWKSIKYGLDEETLKPYCSSSEAITVYQYRIVKLSPIIFTALLPYVVSMINGNFILMIASLVLFILCGIDIVTLFLVRKEDKKALVFNNIKDCGCIIYEIPKVQSKKKGE